MSELLQNGILDACIQRVLELEEEIELVEVTMAGRGAGSTIRAFVWRPGGVTIDDCARINRRLSREIEQEEGLQGQYGIEVSSPGLDRRLHTRRDFERVVGEVLRLHMMEEEGKEKEVVGLLTEVGADDLLMEPVIVPRKGKKKSRGEEREPFRVPLGAVRLGTIEVIL